MKLIITGATGTGKTRIADIICQEINGNILSSDASQVYKYLNIGTNKCITKSKQHLIDLVEPDEYFSVVNYREFAKPILEQLKANYIVPIISGGTGLYIDSFLYKQSYGCNLEKEKQITIELELILQEKGPQFLYDKLLEISPTVAKKTHPNNVKRVLRYLSIIKAGGNIYSKEKKLIDKNFLIIVLNMDKTLLHEKIEKRVHRMIDLGLENEVKNLLNQGYDFSLQSMQAIGYKEWKHYFDHSITKEDVIKKIILNTKQYAKRQSTWFRNQYKSLEHVIFMDTSSIDYNIIIKKIMDLRGAK